MTDNEQYADATDAAPTAAGASPLPGAVPPYSGEPPYADSDDTLSLIAQAETEHWVQEITNVALQAMAFACFANGVHEMTFRTEEIASFGDTNKVTVTYSDDGSVTLTITPR